MGPEQSEGLGAGGRDPDLKRERKVELQSAKERARGGRSAGVQRSPGGARSPERRRQRAGLLGAVRTRAPHKAGAGRGRARPTRPPAPDCRSARMPATVPSPNPNKHENGPGRPASRPFVPAPRGTAAAGIPPRFCVSSPEPLAALPTSAAGRPAAFQGFRLGPLDTQRGAAPLIWGRRAEGRLTLGFAGRGGATEGRAREGCGVRPPLLG